jgi:hypothetical protein
MGKEYRRKDGRRWGYEMNKAKEERRRGSSLNLKEWRNKRGREL